MINRTERAESLMAYDRQYRLADIVVAGMDEVGRGPLAGNVVTACVVMPEEPLIVWIDDSKKLSESRREKVYEEILHHALWIGIGEVSPDEIDEINILQATRKAMKAAAEKVPADIFLIDAVTNLGLKGKEIPLIKGDATSYSIAAASIVAKVTRDRQMAEADRLYPEYGFARNKGYGTREHIEALKKYGPCPIHRRSFIGNFV
ncbi:MAG: ribonuclease HII [Clostridia bacterium]|nr:ribonuclease HII [Clostridia bacterium]